MDETSGKEEDLEKVDASGCLAKIFTDSSERGLRAVHLSSKTDVEMTGKRSFGEKDQELTSNVEDSSVDVIEWVRHSAKIAWKCHKGLKPECPNQDSFSIVLVENEFAIYCVYDGHGPKGHDASDITRTYVVDEFLTRLKSHGNVESAFQEAFAATQELFKERTAQWDNTNHKEGCDFHLSGTTCTIAYHDIPKRRLWIAHVGDSRAVLGIRNKRNDISTRELTRDHKPDLNDERARIERAGGRVVFDGYFNHRVFSKQGMYPGLNMSRALGDVVGHREAGLTALPEVLEVNLDEYEGEVLLLLCTDGVWEFIKSDEAVKMVMGRDDNNDLQAKLGSVTQTSWDRWMLDSEGEISDDITGIAVYLQPERGSCSATS